MKIYFYLTAAIAGLLMAASCQKEGFESADSDYADVSFTTEIPSGVATKAIADGTTVNKLYFEIYEVTEQNGSEVLGDIVFDDVTEISGREATISVRLQKNKEYTAIFWAQYEQELMLQNEDDYYSPYTVTDLTSIKVSYDDAFANDERRDAFYAVVKDVTASTAGYDVTLKRPFAQVNVATSDYYGVTALTSSLTITNVANTFNSLTNTATVTSEVEPTSTVSTEAELTAVFQREVIPSGYLSNVGNGDYKYLAMAYVLVPTSSNSENSTAISTISSDIYVEGISEPITVSYEGATLKQNHRTNLIGNILTGFTNFDIVVDGTFDNDNTYTVGSLEDLKAAITDADKTHKNIILTSGIDITGTATNGAAAITIPENNTVILNLNGNTLTNDFKGGRAFDITGDNVTLMVNAEGSKIEFGNETTGFIQLKGEASNSIVTINGGTFEGTSANGTLVRFRGQVDNNTVTLNNVNYTENADLNTKGTTGNTQNAYVVFADNYNNMGQHNKLIVNGGTFNCVCGFITPFASELNGATIIAKGNGLEFKSVVKGTAEPDWRNFELEGTPATHFVKNCKVQLKDGATIIESPGACIAASWKSKIVIENCELIAPKNGTYALATWGSGGTIEAIGGEITTYTADNVKKEDAGVGTIKINNAKYNTVVTLE